MEEQNTSCCAHDFRSPKFILALIGAILLAGIIVISILRDRIVNYNRNQVTIYGQGKVTYAPDEALVTLGVRIDKTSTAEEAVSKLNEKIASIIAAEKGLGIKDEDMKTQSYSVYPNYEWKDGTQKTVGYNASQQLVVKVRDTQKNQEQVGKAITVGNSAGANEVVGVNYQISSTNNLKQQARVAAINDAKSKAQELFQAAGIKRGKVVGWYENNISSPDMPYPMGMGGSAREEMKSSVPAQVPSGTQEITIEIGVNYEVK